MSVEIYKLISNQKIIKIIAPIIFSSLNIISSYQSNILIYKYLINLNCILFGFFNFYDLYYLSDLEIVYIFHHLICIYACLLIGTTDANYQELIYQTFNLEISTIFLSLQYYKPIIIYKLLFFLSFIYFLIYKFNYFIIFYLNSEKLKTLCDTNYIFNSKICYYNSFIMLYIITGLNFIWLNEIIYQSKIFIKQLKK